MLADPAAYCKAIESQGCQDGLVVSGEPKVAEQAHQVVGHQNEAERGLRDPKSLQAERVESEVLLEFLDPILTAAAESIPMTQPGVSHHACLTHEGDERMTRVAATTIEVVALG